MLKNNMVCDHLDWRYLVSASLDDMGALEIFGIYQYPYHISNFLEKFKNLAFYL